jgi:hypothetical protein
METKPTTTAQIAQIAAAPSAPIAPITAPPAPAVLTDEQILADIDAGKPSELEPDAEPEKPVKAAEKKEKADDKTEPEKSEPKPEKPVYNRAAIEAKRQWAKLSAENRKLSEELKAFKESATPALSRSQDLAQIRSRLADPSVGYEETTKFLRDALDIDVAQTLADKFTGTTPQKTEAKPSSDPLVKQLADKLAALEAEQQKRVQAEAEQAKTATRQAQITQIKAYLDDRAEDYPILSGVEGASLLASEIDRMRDAGDFIGLSEDEVLAEIDQAATKLEEATEKNVERQLKALLGRDKFREIMKRIETENKPSKPTKGTTSKTLKNDMTATPKDMFDYSTATQEEIDRHALAALD